MSEKRGFFGRFFKKKQKEEQPVEEPVLEEQPGIEETISLELDENLDTHELIPAEDELSEQVLPAPEETEPDTTEVAIKDTQEEEIPPATDQLDGSIAQSEAPATIASPVIEHIDDSAITSTGAAPSAVDAPLTEEEDNADTSSEQVEPQIVEDIPTEEPKKKKRGFFSRLTEGLSKTSNKLTGGIGAIFTKRKLDDDTLEELEDLLITADLGVNVATRITAALAKDKFDKEISDEDVRRVLAEQIASSLTPLEKTIDLSTGHKPHVILMTGVNGAGKTTTIGKLAKKFSDEGKSVMLAAGDTFRAAAIEQLTVWGERVGAPVIAKNVGADAAGLAFDALKEAREQNIDVLMIDTAGRLQNRTELMDELAKIVRVIRKLDENAPHDTILVLDATVGQNAISQAQVFTEIAGVSGLVMTKLDGTARGGVLVALADKFALPIHYIGVGESVEDLQPFSAAQFTEALTGISSLTEAA